MSTKNVQFSIIKDGSRVPIHPETGAEQIVDFADAVRAVVNGMGSIDIEDNATTYVRRYLMVPNKTSIMIPRGMRVLIGDTYYHLSSDKTLQLADYVAASNRNGKDFYLYAVPGTGSEVGFIISLNSTVPDGYNSANSRKIGGFHCLCSSVGTISGHPLSGYVIGDIIPGSVWDLAFRPESEPEGMTYVDKIGAWVDIYLASYDGSKLVSRYGGTIADGTSVPKFHGFKFVDYFGAIKKRLPMIWEFMVFSRYSNQGTNIYGSADPGTTGGHVDTGSRRMISGCGLEDCCGVLWQWTTNLTGSGSGWNAATDANDDPDIKGSFYASSVIMALVGSRWDNSSNSGSRSSYFGIGQLYLGDSFTARGLSGTRPYGRVS